MSKYTKQHFASRLVMVRFGAFKIHFTRVCNIFEYNVTYNQTNLQLYEPQRWLCMCVPCNAYWQWKRLHSSRRLCCGYS